MASNETPGSAAFPGIGAPLRRAPKAWQGMMEGFFVRVPQELTRARRNRLALRKLRR
jgi:hypothetical protein